MRAVSATYAVASGLIKRLCAIALMAAQEAVGLRDMHPAEQMRVVGPVRLAVRAGAPDMTVDTADTFDGVVRIFGGTVCGGGQEGTGALQASPRVVAVIGMLRDGDHGHRVQ